MPKYILKFKKQGIIKYTSHLDLLRLFKRAIKISGIPLEYSKGYNPHPKMGFAQPLSLGYTSISEYLEFTVSESLREEIVLGRLREEMPNGIELISLEQSDSDKTLASTVSSAVYEAVFPISFKARSDEFRQLVNTYLSQDEIFALKREKKTKKYVEKNIKDQIRCIKVIESEEPYGNISLLMELDSGSASNLNPDLVVQSFSKYAELSFEKGDVRIERKELIFSK